MDGGRYAAQSKEEETGLYDDPQILDAESDHARKTGFQKRNNQKILQDKSR
jgi:hypothetical protein